jgi:hypothetical protein
MAVEEHVIIRIDVDADITGDLALIERRIRAMEDRFKGLDRRSREVEKSTTRFDKSMSKLGSTVRKTSGMFSKFFFTLSKFSFIGYALEIGVLATALVGARLAMATGRIAAQGYQLALHGVAAAATAVASAVAVAAAAVRQFGEASLSPFVGGNAASANLLRSIDSQTGGLLGRQDATALTGQLGKLGLSGNQASNALKQLFNITAGDTKGVSSLITGLTGDASGFGTALEGIGPQGQGIANQVKGLDKDQIISQLTSGGLTPDAFKGFGDNLASTLLGTIKAEFFGIFNLFADLGTGMIEPFRHAFAQMSGILRSFIMSTAPLIQKFGIESFAPSLLTGMRKTTEWLQKTLQDSLPKIEGIGTRMAEIWHGVGDFFRSMGDAMRPLEAGADVILDVLGRIFGGFGGNGLLSSLNTILTSNVETFRAFGDAFGNLISALLTSGTGDSLLSMVEGMTNAFRMVQADLLPPLVSIANTMHEMLNNALPLIISGIAAVMDLVDRVLSGFSSVTGAIPGGGAVDAAALFAMYAMTKGKGGRTGGMLAGAKGLGSKAMTALSGSRLGMSTFGTRVGVAGLGAQSAISAAALPLAGVAAGGLIMGDSFLDGYRRGDNGAMNIGQGVAGGALAGGAIGTMILPVIGTAVGAAVGAAIGGVGSYLLGRSGKNRREGNAVDSGNAEIAHLLDTLENASGTVVPDLTSELENLLDNEEKFSEYAKERDADETKLRETLESQLDTVQDLQDELDNNLNRNLEDLAEKFSLTNDEAMRLAQTFQGGILGDAIGAADALSAVLQFTPDFDNTSVLGEVVANSQFAKNKEVFGAAETFKAFWNRALSEGTIENFSTQDLQDMLSSRQLVGQGDISVGGFGLTPAMSDQEAINTLFKLGEEGVAGASALGAQLQTDRDALLRDRFSFLAEHFQTDLREIVGEKLSNIITALGGKATSILEDTPTDLEVMELQSFLSSMGELGTLTPTTYDERVAMQVAATSQVVQAQADVKADIDITFMGVLNEQATNEIARLTENSMRAILTRNGINYAEIVGGPATTTTTVRDGSVTVSPRPPPEE